jgi:superoxide dismutase, Fe-Mn family
MAVYTLPDLDYDFGALEPHVSADIMQLHHGKHHKAYVDNANATLDKLAAAREKADFAAIAALERALAFNVSGHVMHSIFWKNMTPKGGGRPAGELAQAIDAHFGSFEAFQKQLSESAATIMGSGWAALSWEPLSQKLQVNQIYDHQSNYNVGSMPIMVIDGWEHAWYLQYKNVKAEFFKALWNIWNWDDISKRYAAAKGISFPGAPKAA